MLVMFVLAALSASIPQSNIDSICRSAQVDSLPEDRVNAMRGCVADEKSAKDQLGREWGRFSAADRANCAETPGMKFSYVELLTCLEMQRGGNFGAAPGTGAAGSPALMPPVANPAVSNPKP